MPLSDVRVCRTRITYLDAELSVSELCILCPRRGTSISHDECLACPECGGGSSDGVVRCLYHGDWQPELEPDRLLAETPLWRIMPEQVACVRATAAAQAAMVLLFTLEATMLPVVDEEGRPIGVIAASDLVHRACAGDTVDDRMTPLVFALPETETVARAAELMEYEGVSHIPVLSQTGRLVGQVSARDLLGWIVRREGLVSPTPRTRLAHGTGERPIP